MSNEQTTTRNPSPRTQDRVIRVFISSTFRDMQAERDYLVKFIFPQLRKLCESRGVTWGEVDLRWGITEEQSQRGEVLPICLNEIKRCRPYFIGILGERYGWIPDALPSDLIEREPWLKEHLHGKTSITELEIIHGVLSEERMRGQAFFYFRDPRYVEQVPIDERSTFIEDNAERTENLERLKTNIRIAGENDFCRLREGYRNAEVLGRAIRRDFTRLINQLYPEGSQPDPLDREAMDHAAYAKSRERVYIGRQEYFDTLDTYALSNDTQPLVILGESGSGKSALLANWLAAFQKTHPDIFVIQHYIGATPYSAAWATMLRRIMGEFKRIFRIQQSIPDDLDALRNAFPDWLSMAAAKGRVVLVLDALNQLEDRDGAADLVWLPQDMPENVRLVVSTLPGKSLDEIHRRGWPAFKVEPLGIGEREKLIDAYLGQYTKNLNFAQRSRIAAAPQSANPLYLRVLLDELRIFGKYEELNERIEYYLKAGSTYDLYEKLIARWEQDYGSDLVRKSLSLIWAARRGLSECELLDLLGKGNRPLPMATWTPFYLAAESSLAPNSGLLTFSHDFVRKAVYDCVIHKVDLEKTCRRNIASYFARQEISLRKVEELPWQLFMLRDWQDLANVLADSSFLPLAWRCQRFDVTGYWAAIETRSPLRAERCFASSITLPTNASEVAEIHAYILGFLGHLTAACERLQSLVIQWREAGDHAHHIIGVRQLAVWQLGAAHLTGARDAAKELENVARAAADAGAVVTALEIQADVLWRTAVGRHETGSAREADELERRAERVCREAGLKEGLARILGRRITRRLGVLKDDSMMRTRGASVLSAMAGLSGNVIGHLQERYEKDLTEFKQLCQELGDARGLLLALRARTAGTGELGPDELQERRKLQQQQMQLARQLGDRQAVGEIMGEMAEGLPPARRIVELAKQEALWRQIGYGPGLAKNVITQAYLYYAEIYDRDQARARGEEGIALLLEASPSRSARVLEWLVKWAMVLKLTKTRLGGLVVVLPILVALLACVFGGLGAVLWHWGSQHELYSGMWTTWRLLAMLCFAKALGVLVVTVLITVILREMGRPARRSVVLPLVLFALVPVLIGGLGALMWRCGYQPYTLIWLIWRGGAIMFFVMALLASAGLVASIMGRTRKGRRARSAGATSNAQNRSAAPEEGKAVPLPVANGASQAQRSAPAAKMKDDLPETVGGFLLRSGRFQGWIKRRVRWQERVIRRLGFEKWPWQLLQSALVGGFGLMLYRSTSVAGHVLWWVLMPVRVFAVVVVLAAFSGLKRGVKRGWEKRFVVTSSQTTTQDTLLVYEIVLAVALFPLRARHVFRRRRV